MRDFIKNYLSKEKDSEDFSSYDDIVESEDIKENEIIDYSKYFDEEPFYYIDLDKAVWANDAIEHLTLLGIIKGYPDNTFRPNDSAKRGDFILVLSKLFDLPKCDENNFKDVKDYEYYCSAILSAVNAGIVKGYPDNTFQPENFIKRDEVFTIIGRILYTDKEIKETDLDVLNKFEDSNEIPDWAKGYIAKLVHDGIINGDGKNINPNTCITRAEMAVLLFNLLNW